MKEWFDIAFRRSTVSPSLKKTVFFAVFVTCVAADDD
jgi:hypothetical protein